MSKLEIGDFVGILDGTEKGFIIKVERNKAWIETTDGFEMTSSLDKLVKYPTPKKAKTKIGSTHSNKAQQLEEFPLEKKPVIKKVVDRSFKVHPSQIGEEKKHSSKKQSENTWEVDLHIEELTDDYRHLTNGEIVDIQLKHAKSILEKARKNKINKIVFIHGKGKGTLRQELLHLLNGFTFLEYYDASFKRYGGGATEVRIFTSKA